MAQFYAYIYRDPSRNFQPIYCGKGSGRRAYEHLKNRDKPHEKENQSFMGRLRNMKEAGIEPVIQIFNCESEELAFLFEEEAIDKYGRIDLGKGPLHNHTNGGEGTSGYPRKGEKGGFFGKSHTEATKLEMSVLKIGTSATPETKKKQSDAKKGENNSFYGKAHTTATKARISATLKGKSQPIVTCPHCGKEGGSRAMKQWHYDNCKYKK